MNPLRARRKNYFIKKSFQANFFLRFALLILLEALLIVGLFIYVSGGTLTTGYQGAALKIEKTSSFFFVAYLLISLIVGIAVGLAGMLVFMFLSHKIAGPLYRFEKSLEEISGGNLTHRIRLRKSDQLGDLAQSLNRFTQRMDETMGRLRKEIHEASKLSSSGEPSVNLPRIKETLNRLKEMIDAFKTTS